MSTPVEKERLNGEAARAADWKRWGLIWRSGNGRPFGRIIRRWEIPGGYSPHLPAGDGEFAIQVIGGADQR